MRSETFTHLKRMMGDQKRYIGRYIRSSLAAKSSIILSFDQPQIHITFEVLKLNAINAPLELETNGPLLMKWTNFI